MNLILLEPGEVDAHGQVTLTGQRAQHVLRILKSKVGDTLRIGVLDGAQGAGEVIGLSSEVVHLRCNLDPHVPALPDDMLLLAVPRPIVLKRCLAHATALGFGHIALFRSARVDKSHVLSKIVREPSIQHAYLIAGLEQSRRTRLPMVTVFDQFKPFVEDVLPEMLPPNAACIVGDADAEASLRDLNLETAAPICLAVGPEGGLLPYEIGKLVETGFRAVNVGSHPLRVETALAVLTGQLQLLRG